VEKLGVKNGDTVSLLGEFPKDFLRDLKKTGADIFQDKPIRGAAWYLLAADHRQELKRVKALAKSLQGSAGLWIVYPKGQKAITESDVRSAGLNAGLTDVKVARFNDTHTALKFAIPKSKR
jgi:hypothetical protein